MSAVGSPDSTVRESRPACARASPSASRWLALSQWGLGYPERALASTHEAARLAETLGLAGRPR